MTAYSAPLSLLQLQPHRQQQHRHQPQHHQQHQQQQQQQQQQVVAHSSSTQLRQGQRQRQRSSTLRPISMSPTVVPPHLHRLPASLSGVREMTLRSVLESATAAAEDPASSSGSRRSSNQHQHDHSGSRSADGGEGGSLAPPVVSLHDRLLHVLTKRIGTAGPALSAAFFESCCPVELLLSLLQSPSLSTRVAVLRLLHLFVRSSPTLRAQFERVQGFVVLASVLSAHALSEELLGILFCMLLGKPVGWYLRSVRRSPSSSAAGCIKKAFLGKLDGITALFCPRAAITILALLHSPDLPAELRYYSLKTLHDVFLQSDDAKRSLIDTGLIQRLCDLLPPLYECQVLLQQASTVNWSLEQPVLTLLKDACLFDLRSGSDLQVLRSVIVHLTRQVPTLPSAYVHNLQLNIVYAMLDFAHRHLLRAKHVASIQQLIILTLQLYLWPAFDGSTPFDARDPSGVASYSTAEQAGDSVASVSRSASSTALLSGEAVDLRWVEWSLLSQSLVREEKLLEMVTRLLIARDETKTRVLLREVNEDLLAHSFASVFFHLLLVFKETQQVAAILPHSHLGTRIEELYRNQQQRQRQEEEEHRATDVHHTVADEDEEDEDEDQDQDEDQAVRQTSSSEQDRWSRRDQDSESALEMEPVRMLHEYAGDLVGGIFRTLSSLTDVLEYFLSRESFVFRFLDATAWLLGVADESVSWVVYNRRIWAILLGNQQKLLRDFMPIPYAKICSEMSGSKALNELFPRSSVGLTDVGEVNVLHLLANVNERVREKERDEQVRCVQWVRDIKAGMLLFAQADIQESVATRKYLQGLKTAFFSTQMLFKTQKMKLDHDDLQAQLTTQRQWKLVVKNVYHDRALGINVDVSWKLDPTEGTDRMRIRMKRNCTNPMMYIAPHPSYVEAVTLPPDTLLSPTMINERFKMAMDEYEAMAQCEETNQDIFYLRHKLRPGETVQRDRVVDCWFITPMQTRKGELLICSQCAYFVEDQLSNSEQAAEAAKRNKLQRRALMQVVWPYEDVKEIHKRRYLLQTNALEIFLITGITSLVAFDDQRTRDQVYDLLLSMELPNRVDYGEQVSGNLLRLSITQKWQRGLVSNFEYLMHLNTLAGRSFRDLTQYPVFPYVLADYESEELDLENPATFRDLSKAMGAQNPERLEKFIQKYHEMISLDMVPFQYGSHYSNMGSVLHYLVRVEPFTSYFLDFQGGRFDVPDRAFHGIAQTWRLSSATSSSDVKELIPEFFFFPEFLENLSRFDMGVKQNDVRVDHVILPPWAHDNPHLFIRKQREALECQYVSRNLHHWIDLIFGYKQTGEAAATAMNLFHPLTYEGADIATSDDPVQHAANIAQIQSYGQTPKQLFTRPHPQRSRKALSQAPSVYSHPQNLSARPMWSTSSSVGFLAVVGDTTVALGRKKLLLSPSSSVYVSWGHWDQNLRICSLEPAKVLAVWGTNTDDDVICADVPRSGRVLVTGGTAGVVRVWRRELRNTRRSSKRRERDREATRGRSLEQVTNSAVNEDYRARQAQCVQTGYVVWSSSKGTSNSSYELSLQASLFGHTRAIKCVAVSEAWSVIVSGSSDRTCIIWDLNRLMYVRSLQLEGTVRVVAISPVNGRIFTASDVDEDCSLSLWTINGRLLGQAMCTKDRALCAIFTTGVEGVCRNVVAVGMKSGVINILDAWDLSQVARHRRHSAPVSALCLNRSNTQLISGDLKGILLRWTLDMDKAGGGSLEANSEDSVDSGEDASSAGAASLAGATTSGSSAQQSGSRARASASARLRSLSTFLF
mmetsp:Transcript_362/g.1054  ORF Transcript_362/g.1054 Transcript_362/m.1054 type:complete len:1779 (-) Transcript_362:1128-6464(-)